MRILSIISIVLFISATSVFGQLKVGYVDSDTILKELPDAKDVQTKLDATIKEWKDELQKMEREYKTKVDEYENRKLIMSRQKQRETEKELEDIEKSIDDYRQKKFGVNGELFKNQEELMKPIQNLVFNAIKEVAEENELDFVFDRSGDIMFLYAKEEYDITNLVLEKFK